MKNIGVIIIAVLVAFAATSHAVSTTWGMIGSKDKILFSQRIFNYTYPYGISRNAQFPEYKKTNKVTITAVQALDNSPNKSNSHPTLLAGGPGFKYVTVNFQARSENNLDYQFVVYGKK